jgi:enoyl-CoA hydratase
MPTDNPGRSDTALGPEESDCLLYAKEGPIAVITLNRPKAHNAISTDLAHRLDAAFEEFEADDSLKVAILTAAGTTAFCAGADLKSAIPAVTSGGDTTVDPAHRALHGITKPVIAAVNGFALAGGFELLYGTDLRIAADHATFGLPEVTLGLVPFGGSHVRLPQQIPWAVAMEMMLLGDRITAERAKEIGFVNTVVPGIELMSEAHRLAERLCRNGPVAVRAIKQSVMATYHLPWEEAFTEEYRRAMEVMRTEDAKEGPRAFVEKRRPTFVGR